MEDDDFHNFERANSEFKDGVRTDVEYIRHVPNKDNEFKVKMWEDELNKQQSKNLEVNDWTMYDGQYPRLGPIIFTEDENATLLNKGNNVFKRIWYKKIKIKIRNDYRTRMLNYFIKVWTAVPK